MVRFSSLTEGSISVTSCANGYKVTMFTILEKREQRVKNRYDGRNTLQLVILLLREKMETLVLESCGRHFLLD